MAYKPGDNESVGSNLSEHTLPNGFLRTHHENCFSFGFLRLFCFIARALLMEMPDLLSVLIYFYLLFGCLFFDVANLV